MKIQCDVCCKAEASVFCSADEAALCGGCDHKVHHANKLASKHQRFSLIHPSPSEAPICDICQEKRGMLFCQQDRAILCRDCDLPIHTANTFTQEHSRFFLTGLKLSSPISAPASSSTTRSSTTTSITSSSTATTTTPTPTPKVVSNDSGGSLGSSDGDSVPGYKAETLTSTNKKPNFVSSGLISQPLNILPKAPTTTTVTTINGNNQLIKDSGGSISSISEYLIEMLPGWQVEELLDLVPNPGGGGLHKDCDGNLISGLDEYIDQSGHGYSQNVGLWAPHQAPVSLQPALVSGSSTFGQRGLQGGKGKGMGGGTTRLLDDVSIVPQMIISPRSVGSKRSRSSW